MRCRLRDEVMVSLDDVTCQSRWAEELVGILMPEVLERALPYLILTQNHLRRREGIQEMSFGTVNQKTRFIVRLLRSKPGACRIGLGPTYVGLKTLAQILVAERNIETITHIVCATQ